MMTTCGRDGIGTGAAGAPGAVILARIRLRSDKRIRSVRALPNAFGRTRG